MITPDPIAILKEEEQRAWASWHLHPMRIVLHNEAVRPIHFDRDRLELAPPSEVMEIQTRLRLRRDFLSLLHSKDPKPKT